MFDINQHRHDYFYNLATVIGGLIPDELCDTLARRVNSIMAVQGVDWVKHQGPGTDAVSDLGGVYNHHIFNGDDIRRYVPELTAIYHSLVPLISLITHTDTVVSPYPLCDINIRADPPGGGTLGLHYDTNGITVLLFLTTNQEAPLCMQIERHHPSQEKPWIQYRRIYASKGSLLIMQGRKTLHHSEPTVTEQKLSVVYNYYERHDTYRHEDCDTLMYYGKQPKTLA